MMELQPVLNDALAWLQQHGPAVFAGAAAAGEAVGGGMAKAAGSDIWDKIKSKLPHRSDVALAEEIETEGPTEALVERFKIPLREALEQDPAFREELAALLKTTTVDASKTVTQQAKAGDNSTINQTVNQR